jgi:hypothetical protein
MKQILVVYAVLGAAPLPEVSAELISFRMQGTVTVFDEGLLPPEIVTGMPFTATLTYDLGAPDQLPDDPQQSWYLHMPPTVDIGFSMNVGSLDFRSDPRNSFYVQVGNDLPDTMYASHRRGDWVVIPSTDVLTSLNLEGPLMGFVLWDRTGEALSSTDLPTHFDVSKFGEATIFLSGNGSDRGFLIQATPSIVEQIPEPPAAVLLASLFAGTIFWVMLRRRTACRTQRRQWRIDLLERRDVLSGSNMVAGDSPTSSNNSVVDDGLDPVASLVDEFAAPGQFLGKLASRYRAAVAAVKEIEIKEHGKAEPSVQSAYGQFNDENAGQAHVSAEGRVQSYIHVAEATDAVIAEIESLGIEVQTRRNYVPVIQALVPQEALEPLAELSNVRWIELPDYAITDTGSLNTAGDGILRADDVRSAFAAYGIDGSGVKVGVISDGVLNAGFIASEFDPNLPSSITVDPGHPGNNGDEGTAMLEIIHDLAPGAALYFSGWNPDGTYTSADMEESIEWMISQEVDVIVDDIQLFREPYFFDGSLALTVEDAVESGVVFVTAAGNRANRHYQGFWNPDPLTGNQWHDFNVTATRDIMLNVSVPAGVTVVAFLQWSDPQGTSSNNYDLHFFESGPDGDEIGFAGDEVQDGQGGDDFPIEVASWANNSTEDASVRLRIKGLGANLQTRELELYIRPNNTEILDDERTPGNSMFGHKAIESVITVGAVSTEEGPDYDVVEEFSSQGPTTIYTDFGAAQESVERDTLDGVAIDDVQTRASFLNFIPGPLFGGTSAAAPHVAAIAALVLDANPDLTPAQVSSILAETSTDIQTTGYDDVTGNGRFDALRAVYRAFKPATPDLVTADDTGVFNMDNVTELRQPRFTGTAPLGSYVRLYLDGVQVNAVQLGATESVYTLAPGTALANGEYDVTVRFAENAATPEAINSNPSDVLSVTIDQPDVNGDANVDRTDVAVLATNFGRTSGATHAQGDVNGDARTDGRDLHLVQISLSGGEGLMGGGGDGESTGGGGEGGGGEETSGGESGGGGESFSGTPARFYFTTSASTSGGGTLGSSVPGITLPSPGQFVDLYVWVQMGDYDRLGGYGLDVRATTSGVVKATASQVYNAEIWDVELDEYVGDRWNGTALLSGTLNASGLGAAELATGPGSFAIGGGMELLDEHDGGSSGLVDMLYDAANDAFLLQRVRLEALPGSAGSSTGLSLSIGRLGLLVDNTSIYTSLPIYLGLGTTSIENNVIGATDGSTHATITVSAGSPGAVVVSVNQERTSARLDAAHTPTLRAIRGATNFGGAVTTRIEPNDAPPLAGRHTLRAVRRELNSRAIEPLLHP